MHNGSGIFLVMDDEEMISSLLSYLLSSFGYTVVIKENGSDVINYIKSTKVVGIILDLIMPDGFGGAKVIKEIRKLTTSIPVFISSGYTDDPIMICPVEYGFTASICKPFSKKMLSMVLNKFMKSGL